MFGTTAVAVNHSARCLTPIYGNKEESLWIVGTCSLSERNEITLLSYSEDNNSNNLDTRGVFSHPDEIWALEASHHYNDLIITSSHKKSGGKSLRLWKMNLENDGNESIDSRSRSASVDDNNSINNNSSFNLGDTGDELKLLSDFNSHSSFINSIKWSSKDESTVITKDPHYITQWSVTSTGTSIKEISKFELPLDSDVNNVNNHHDNNDFDLGMEGQSGGLSCSTFDKNIAAAISQSQLQIIDFRSSKEGTHIKNIHQGGAQDVDFNPNRENVLLTTGNDRTAKLWDLRNTSSPVRVLYGHAHWVTCGKYNPIHDQLLMTGGVDNIVNLWRVASLANTPWLGNNGSTSSNGRDSGDINGDVDPPDVRAKVFDQHEDSVCDVAWSYADPWVACSLSFDGRIVLNKVPSTEKYKILL